MKSVAASEKLILISTLYYLYVVVVIQLVVFTVLVHSLGSHQPCLQLQQAAGSLSAFTWTV